MAMYNTVGIDLGTTHTVVSSVIDGETRLLDFGGRSTLPSLVCIGSDGYGGIRTCVGGEALRHDCRQRCSHTISSVKRLMGTGEMFCGLKAHEVSAEILRYVRAEVVKQFGFKDFECVITVPAHFSEGQRVATKQAASLAGLRVSRLINEPTAAAIAYGLSERCGVHGVYDLGGGTFDFSILRFDGDIFHVLATGGDVFLGGDDIDRSILQYNLSRLGVDMAALNDDLTLELLKVCRHLKESIGDQDLIRAEIQNDAAVQDICQQDLHNDDGRIFFELSRDFLSEELGKLVSKTLQICDHVIADADNVVLDSVVLVGGMSRLHMLQESVREHFSCTVHDKLHPDEAVAIGAAVHADAITNKSSIVVVDVTPLSLGIETMGGAVDVIIPRNTPIPYADDVEYTTYVDNQRSISFNVVQGERSLASECQSLARFELSGLPLRKAHELRIRVTFSIDVNGLLTVTARDSHSFVAYDVVVEPYGGLSIEDMKRYLHDASRYKESDERALKHSAVRAHYEQFSASIKCMFAKIPALVAVQSSLQDFDELLQKQMDEDEGLSLLETAKRAIEADVLEILQHKDR